MGQQVDLHANPASDRRIDPAAARGVASHPGERRRTRAARGNAAAAGRGGGRRRSPHPIRQASRAIDPRKPGPRRQELHDLRPRPLEEGRVRRRQAQLQQHCRRGALAGGRSASGATRRWTTSRRPPGSPTPCPGSTSSARWPIRTNCRRSTAAWSSPPSSSRTPPSRSRSGSTTGRRPGSCWSCSRSSPAARRRPSVIRWPIRSWSRSARCGSRATASTCSSRPAGSTCRCRSARWRRWAPPRRARWPARWPRRTPRSSPASASRS